VRYSSKTNPKKREKKEMLSFEFLRDSGCGSLELLLLLSIYDFLCFFMLFLAAFFLPCMESEDTRYKLLMHYLGPQKTAIDDL
jgi:hypothetical protein